MKSKVSKKSKYSILNEFDLSFISSKDKNMIFFYNNHLVYYNEPNLHYYNVELQKDDLVCDWDYFIFTQINKDKVCFVFLNSICIFNYTEKNLEKEIPAFFYLLFDVICLEETILVILGRDYIHIVDINTEQIVKIKYPNWEFIEGNIRRVLPLNDDLVIVRLPRGKGTFFCLINWKTKQLVTSINFSTIYINRTSGKIEKGFIENKPISRLFASNYMRNIGEIFTLDSKFYNYMDKNKITFYFTIVKNRIIGYLKNKGDNNIIMRIIDIKNYKILQQFEFKNEFSLDDFYSNSVYFIFRFFNEYVGFKINKENVEKYLQEKQ